MKKLTMILLLCFWGQLVIGQQFYGIDLNNPKFIQDYNAPKLNKLDCPLSTSTLKSSVIGCAYNDIINTSNNSAYIPNDYSPLIYVRINIHVMQKKDGSGNFPNNTEGLAFINNCFNAMCGIYSNVEAPVVGGVTGVLTVKDTKIRFILAGIYFHQDDIGWTNNHDLNSMYCFDHYAVNTNKELNVFLCEAPTPEITWGSTNSGIGQGRDFEDHNFALLLGMYADSQVIMEQSFQTESNAAYQLIKP